MNIRVSDFVDKNKKQINFFEKENLLEKERLDSIAVMNWNKEIERRYIEKERYNDSILHIDSLESEKIKKLRKKLAINYLLIFILIGVMFFVTDWDGKTLLSSLIADYRML